MKCKTIVLLASILLTGCVGIVVEAPDENSGFSEYCYPRNITVVVEIFVDGDIDIHICKTDVIPNY